MLPKWLWGLLFIVVFIFSILWHLPSGAILQALPGYLPNSAKGLNFDSSQGTLWEGKTQIEWLEPHSQKIVALGEVSWKQKPVHLITQINPEIKWQTQFGQWQGTTNKSWNNERLRIHTQDLKVDIKRLLHWLSPFAKVPFEIAGQVESKKLNFEWSQSKLLLALDAKLRVTQLSTMGIAMPPIHIELQMLEQDTQVVQWKLTAEDNGWKMQGSGTVDMSPESDTFGRYQGEIEVKAESAQKMPDFAHLMPQLKPELARMKLNGNLGSVDNS